jgi:hypothetical protein
MTNRPPLGMVDVFTATVPTLAFKSGVHVSYAETVLPMKDAFPRGSAVRASESTLEPTR